MHSSSINVINNGTQIFPHINATMSPQMGGSRVRNMLPLKENVTKIMENGKKNEDHQSIDG